MSMNSPGGFGGGLPPQPDLSGGNFGMLSESMDDADLGGGKKKKRRGKVKSGAESTPRVLNQPRKIAIALAVLAVVALLGLVFFGGGAKSYVAVVNQPVNAYSPVTPDNVSVVEMSTDLIEPGAISGSDSNAVLTAAATIITDTTTQWPLFALQQLHPEQFSNSGATLAKPLGPDERLMSLRANVSSTVAGSLKAGDRVDIVATDNNSNGLAGIVAEDIELVKVAPNESALDAAGDTTSGSGASSTEPGGSTEQTTSNTVRPVGGTYVIRIPADLVPAIASIDSSASRVYLVYRSPDAKDATEQSTTLRDSLCRSGGCK